MLRTILRDIGLSEKESVIYLTVMEQGKITPADLARLTGINRTTVYAVAKELQKKGMISEEHGTTTYLVANPPDELHTLLTREREQLRRKEHLVKSAITELEPLMKGMRYAVPRLTFVDESQLTAHLYAQTEKWAHSTMQYDGIWYGFQDHSFLEPVIYNEWIDWTWKQSCMKDMHVRLLTNLADVELSVQRRGYERRHMKFWKDGELTSTLWINGDYLVMIVSRTHPHYLVEIEDRLLAHNMREMFKRLWEVS